MGSEKQRLDQLQKDISDEVATVILNSKRFESLLHTRRLLKKKVPLSQMKKGFKIETAISELNEFIDDISTFFMSNGEIEEHEDNQQVLSAVIGLLKTIFAFRIYNDLPTIFKIAGKLTDMLCFGNISTELKNEISSLCEFFIKTLRRVDRLIMIKSGLFIVNYLLDLTLCAGSDEELIELIIKRLYSIRMVIQDFLDRYTIRLEAPHLTILYETMVPKLIESIANRNLIKSEEGQQFVSYVMSRNTSLASQMHTMLTTIIHDIRVPKEDAAAYGKIYYMAWMSADDDKIKKTIGERILDVTRNFIYDTSRTGLKLPRACENSFVFLRVLHSCKPCRSFSNLLTELFICWESRLKSPLPTQRCNAALLFFDLFPLEKPYSRIHDVEEFLYSQIEHMRDLVEDVNHCVRSIAVKETFRALTDYLQYFVFFHLKEILKILFVCIPAGETTYQVRKQFLEGVEIVLRVKPGADGLGSMEPCLMPFVKCLLCFLKDKSETVRKTFVRILVRIHRSPHIPYKYSSFLCKEVLVEHCAKEGPMVGELISLLLKDDTHYAEQTPEEMIKVFCKMLDYDENGTKNLFRYSYNVWTVSEAYNIITNIISKIKSSVLENMDEKNNNKEKTPKRKLPSKQSSGKVAKRRSSFSSSSCVNVPESSSLSTPVNNPETSSVVNNPEIRSEDLLLNNKYATSLMQIGTIVWVLFREDLHCNPEFEENLYSLTCSSVPLFIKYYKGTPAYYATLSLASLLSPDKHTIVLELRNNVMADLKMLKPREPTDSFKLESMVYALCSWNFGNKFLELVLEWMNHDLCRGLRRTKKQRRDSAGKPLFALSLLETALSNDQIKSKLVSENYDDLFKIYKSLRQEIKGLVHATLKPKYYEKYPPSDEFILKAFCMFLRLVGVLNRKLDQNLTQGILYLDAAEVDAVEESISAMKFASGHMLKYIKPFKLRSCKTLPLGPGCFYAVLCEATELVNQDLTSEEHLNTLCDLTISALSIDNIMFIEAAVHAVYSMSKHALKTNDEWKFLSLKLYSLQKKLLNAFGDSKATRKQFFYFIKDHRKLRYELFFPLKIIFERGGHDQREFVSMVDEYMETAISSELICLVHTDNKVINTRSVLSQHPILVEYIMNYFLMNFVHEILPSLGRLMPKKHSYSFLSVVNIVYTLTYTSKHRFVQRSFEKIITDISESLKALKHSTSSEDMETYKLGAPLVKELIEYVGLSLSID